MVQRLRPVPVGSTLTMAMKTHLSAAGSLGKCLQALTARRIQALTLVIALVEQITRGELTLGLTVTKGRSTGEQLDSCSSHRQRRRAGRRSPLEPG
jgi:hypothetical protein